MKKKDKYKWKKKKYFIDIYQCVYKEVSEPQKYKKKITEKLQKEKLSGSRLVMKFLLFTRRNRRDISLYAILLHAAAIAKDEGIIHLLLIVHFKLLPLRCKLPL